MTTHAPAPQSPSKPWVIRDAKLFEAGDYPDKGVTVTPEQLHRLADAFTEPVPLLIEHSASPLEIGFLSSVRCEGAELFGTLSLSPEADALVERSSAKSLSLGLAKDLTSIREVSLVRHPRIASARMFGEAVNFVGRLAGSSDERDHLRRARVELEIEDLLREGRLTPAQSSFAASLLMADDTVEFDGASLPIADLVRKLIRAQPRLELFSEMARQPASSERVSMPPEEAEFYRRHFPDLSLSDIAHQRK